MDETCPFVTTQQSDTLRQMSDELNEIAYKMLANDFVAEGKLALQKSRDLLEMSRHLEDRIRSYADAVHNSDLV